MVKPLVIRADANAKIGAGHFMRCLALAEGWRAAGGGAVFVQAERSSWADERLAASGLRATNAAGSPGSAEDAARLSAIAREHGADWIVVDGYAFGADYQRQLKDAGHRVLLVDDYGHASPYCADLVVNQNLGAQEELYARTDPSTQLLLGTRFVLLRREFLRRAEEQRPVATSGPPFSILVALGGADPDNATLKATEALRALPGKDWRATIVVGAWNPHRASIAAAVQAAALPAELMFGTNDLAALMAQADVAIAAGGATCWELAFCGVPMLLTALADNQLANVRRLTERGAALNLGNHESLKSRDIARALDDLLSNAGQRESMAQRARELVDGEGVERVRLRLEGRPLRLRPARPADARTFWQWVNDPQARRMSFQSAPIDWSEHESWFKARMCSPRSLLLLGLDPTDVEVGQVRFDWTENNQAEVDLSIAPPKRGRGLGGELLRAATNEVFRTTEVEALHAYIKPENGASIRVFEKAGFHRLPPAQTRGQRAEHFILERRDG